MRVAALVAMFVSGSKPSWSPVRALRLVLLLGLLLGWDHLSDAHKVAKGNHAQDDAALEAAAAPWNLVPTARWGAKVHIVAEIGDPDFTGDRMALLCGTYMNAMENVFIVTDSFDAVVPGSPAHEACSPHIRILSTGQPDLHRDIATAQLRRAWVIDAYLEEVGRSSSGDGATNVPWVVLTEFDTWWEPRLLEEYVEFMEERRGDDGDIVLGGAGSGSLSMDDGERRAVSSHLSGRGTTRHVPLPYGGATLLLLSDLRFVYGEVPGGAASCQKRLLHTCFAEENNEGNAAPLYQCSGRREAGCDVLCGATQYRYEGAPFNNDHSFMACVADKAAKSSRSISPLWARTSDNIYFSINKFVFQYDLIDPSADVSLRWNNLVAAHHVTDEWLRKVSRAKKASPWPTIFLLGNPKSATSSIFAFITETEGSDVCGGRVLAGEPDYYDKEQHAFDRLEQGWTLNISRYLRHYAADAHDKFCRRFMDATPSYFSDGGTGDDPASQRMWATLPPGIRTASTFVIALREPLSFAKSYHTHGCSQGWLKPKDICADLELFLEARVKERWHSAIFAYKSNLKRWFETFGRSRFLVLQFETLSRSLDALEDFLDFPEAASPAHLRHTNEAELYRTASS